MGLLRLELRKSVAHLRCQCRNDLVEKQTLRAQLVAMSAGAANDATQHIATPFIGRQHAISNQEAARTNVIRNHL